MIKLIIRAKLALFGAVFTLLLPASSHAIEDCSLILKELMTRLEATEQPIPREDFSDLSLVLDMFQGQHTGTFVAQFILDSSRPLTLSLVHEIEKYIEGFGLRNISELSFVSSRNQGMVTQVFTITGSKKNLDNFLKSDFTSLEEKGLVPYLDPLSLPGVDEKLIKFARIFNPNMDLAQKIIPRIGGLEISAGPPSPLEFKDPQLGSYKEFSRRFGRFSEYEMATKIFNYLSRYLRSTRREAYLKKIEEIGFKASTTTMASGRTSQKSLGQLISGLKELAEFYLLDRPSDQRIRPEKIHLKGQVTLLLDALGVPQKVKDSELTTPPPPDTAAFIPPVTPLVSPQIQKAEDLFSVRPQILKLSEVEENPELLSVNSVYITDANSQIVFADEPIKYLKRRYLHLIPKFIKALQKGVVPPQGSDGIKFMSNLAEGRRGQPFEVKLVGRGHHRLIGCYLNGVFTILRFDADAPTTVDGWNRRYGYLCR